MGKWSGYADDTVTPPAPPGAGLLDAVGSLSGKLELHVGSTNRKLDSLAAQMRRPPPQPSFARVTANDVVPASGLLVLDLGGPAQGRVWNVRRVNVGGLTPTTATAGRADIYVSAGPMQGYATLGRLGVGDWVDQATTLPNIGWYARGSVPVQHQERLFIVFSGATAAQSYVAGAQVEDFETAAYAEVRGIG